MKTYEEIDENGDDIHYNSDGTRLVLNAAQEKYVTDWHNHHDAHPGPLWLSDEEIDAVGKEAMRRKRKRKMMLWLPLIGCSAFCFIVIMLTL